MAKVLKFLALTFTTLFVGILVWYLYFPNGVLLSVCITLGVFTYHFLMRLVIGHLVNGIFHNRMDYNKKWFQPRKFERKLYTVLKLRAWKKHIPTYSPETFSLEKHTFQELAMATCQAEIVHELIILFSFLPVLLIIPFGEPLVFILTSLFSAGIDLVFVLLQRYNRPKLLALIAREERKSK